ncbi:arsenite resistance protein ArsB [Ceratobasidium sp. AG-Ba]|nr:arsenite resistance protein ArsB [Ceratobasidium sp. AG-Ba]
MDTAQPSDPAKHGADVQELCEMDPPLFRQSCTNCDFCSGLRDMDPVDSDDKRDEQPRCHSVRAYLAIFILLAMISGVLIGVYKEDGVQRAFAGASWQGTNSRTGSNVRLQARLGKAHNNSHPYGASHHDVACSHQSPIRALAYHFKRRNIWLHIGISLILKLDNRPSDHVGLAWATLPEAHLERERKGVILVGIARCIAMVLIWNGLACGDLEYCAILVCVNSILQVVLFSPYSLSSSTSLAEKTSASLHLDYSYCGKRWDRIPLAAGIVTRFVMKRLLSAKGFDRFLKLFGPFALGLLYTIVVLFAFQGNRIVHNIGSVFRHIVPLILYFVVVWFTQRLRSILPQSTKTGSDLGGYEKTVVQAFTTGSNNFELAIAVAIASFGTDSPEALAATQVQFLSSSFDYPDLFV